MGIASYELSQVAGENELVSRSVGVDIVVNAPIGKLGNLFRNLSKQKPSSGMFVQIDDDLVYATSVKRGCDPKTYSFVGLNLSARWVRVLDVFSAPTPSSFECLEYSEWCAQAASRQAGKCPLVGTHGGYFRSRLGTSSREQESTAGKETHALPHKPGCRAGAR